MRKLYRVYEADRDGGLAYFSNVGRTSVTLGAPGA